MAEKRMFSKTIIDSDTFLEMPLSTQALYFHLSMRADDDGFLNNARKVQRIIGASEDDLKLLILKRFIIAFNDGIIVIKHWRMNNYLRKDRYTPTIYQEEFAMLEIKDNGAYTLPATTGIPDDNRCVTQISIDKVSKDKISIDNTICPEPELAQDRKIVITLTLNDNSEYEIYGNQVDEWSEAFPAVDVMQELKKMKSWLTCNPRKRKSRRGTPRFVNNWLSTTQEKKESNVAARNSGLPARMSGLEAFLNE